MTTTTTKTIKTLALLGLVIATALPLSACNTMRGLGEDAQAAGRGLSNAAQDNKDY